MPHVIIKAIAGQPRDKMQEIAEKIKVTIVETLNAPEKVVSVSLEEFPFDGWPEVYDECIKDKANVLVKPGYTNPKTFE